MAGRQCRQLFPAADVEATGADQDRANALLRKSREGRFQIAVGCGTHNNELPAQRSRRCLQVCDDILGIWKGRVYENAKHGSIG